ncbi:MAG: hypothetical protein ACREA0_00555 [bacterium]
MDLSRSESWQGPPAVVIDVKELVLIGFPPMDRYAVGDVFRQELANLMIRQYLDRGSRGTDRNTRVRPSPGASERQAREVGRSVAESVFKRLSR